MNKLKIPPPSKPRPVVPYKPAPHPMQYRLDEFRIIPSVWTGPKREE